MRCLCCDRDITEPTEYERQTGWHTKCVKKFFGTTRLPELVVTEDELEKLANSTVHKGLTVPGVQKKLSLHLGKEDKVSKLTIVDYPTGYILKPQSAEYEALPEAEFLVMKMGEKVGIATVPCALMKLGDRYAYITKRVDRIDNKISAEKGKGEQTVNFLAMEDFCQLSGRITSDKYKSSYEKCGKIIEQFSRNVGIDMTELFYRLVFCYVTGNSDMHLKNFSLLESKPASRVFGLSPAYDLLPVNVIMPADKEQTALSLNGKKRNIRRKDFFQLAESYHIGEKTADRLINRIVGYEEELIKMVDSSYIPDKYCETMKALISQRCDIIK